MVDFKKYKKTSSAELQRLLDEFEKNKNQQQNFKDDRFWTVEQDKAGNAFATIRFLDSTNEDEFPYVRLFSHSFQGPTGKWYIENSLTTFGEDDPVAEYNSVLWNSGSEANKEIAKKQKRKLNYIAKILVITDSKHPEFEGQVKFFKFGKKIFDKIMDKAKPTFEDETPVNVFNFFAGADFKLKIRRVEGYANYDKSEFSDATPLVGGDEKKMAPVVEAAEKLGPLSQFLDRKKYFKTYEELEKKMNLVLKGTKITTKKEVDDDQKQPSEPKSQGERRQRQAEDHNEDNGQPSGNDAETLSFFQKLANNNQQITDDDIPF